MENNENLVLDEGTENVEQPTEETPKLYTEEEFHAKVNEVAGKRVARREAKIRKEVEREYKDLVGTLEAGTGKKGVKELNEVFTAHYKSRIKDFKVNKEPEYSAKDIEVLARAEADEIINAGFEEVIEEADRLNELGAEGMTAKEKALFRELTSYIQTTERSKELSKIGITEEVYNSKEFQDFASKFNSNTPIKDIYDIYNKTQTKKEFKTTGSMKSTMSKDNGVKDYYTPEEARKFTKKELDDNPAIYQSILNSMPKWKK